MSDSIMGTSDDMLIHEGNVNFDGVLEINSSSGLTQQLQDFNSEDLEQEYPLTPDQAFTEENAMNAIEDLYMGMTGTNTFANAIGSQSLTIGGPKDGEFIATDEPFIKCYEAEFDTSPVFEDDREYEEKTLVISEDGERSWVGWESKSDSTPRGLETNSFEYQRIIVNRNNQGMREYTTLFVPSDINIPISSEEVIDHILNLVDTQLSQEEIYETFRVDPSSYNMYFNDIHAD